MVKGYQRDGVPVDGIGFQSHFYVGGVPSTLQQNLQRFADLGLDVAITELDINLRGPATPALLEQQAKDYWTVVNACVQVKRCVSVVSILFSSQCHTTSSENTLAIPDCMGRLRRPLVAAKRRGAPMGCSEAA